MRKKLLSVLVAATMTIAMLAGCGNSNAGDASDDAAGNAGDKVSEAVSEAAGGSAEGLKIGMTVPSIGNDFMLALTGQMRAALEAEGCTVQFDSAENDVTTQIEQIENDITMECDILVVWAVNGDGVSSACKKAVDEGIPVLAFAYEIPDASSAVISATDEDMGAAGAEMASSWIDENFADAGDGEVKVFVMTSSTTPESVIRSNALLAIENNSKVELVTAEVEDQDNSDAARTLTENTLLANPDIDVIICMNGTCGIGAESYVMSASSPIEDKSKFAIFCVDETDEIDAKILASKTDESVLRGTISMGSLDATVTDFMKGMTPLLSGETPVDIHGSATTITAESLE